MGQLVRHFTAAGKEWIRKEGRKEGTKVGKKEFGMKEKRTGFGKNEQDSEGRKEGGGGGSERHE
jgi:hypothetical protein